MSTPLARGEQICDPANVHSFSTPAKLTLALVAIVGRCAACSLSFPLVEAGPDFRVAVANEGRPVKGLRVRIHSLQKNGITTVAITDENGVAHFRGVPSGSYHLDTDHDTGIPDGVDLNVRLDRSIRVTVPLRWPVRKPIQVRSLTGTIRLPDHFLGEPQTPLSVDLLDGISARKLDTVLTTEKGEFSFQSAAPGLYFLRLNPSGPMSWSREPISGLMAIAVERNANADHVDLDLGWTSCGLWYADGSKCPQNDLQMEQLSGQVVDAGGKAISKADIFLIAGKLVEHLQSDSSGKFASARALSGTYRLLVTRAGFTPLRRTLQASSTGNSRPSSVLMVQLGLFGTCSTATLQ